MAKIVFYTGGIRSGKSKIAEDHILSLDYEDRIYLATAKAFDEEMNYRIEKHKQRRQDKWTTIEAFDNLENILLQSISKKRGVILLDCLSNMVSNMMLFKYQIDYENATKSEIKIIEDRIIEDIINLRDFFVRINYDVFIVSNEVGSSLVSTFPLGRHFQDICGKANQIMAELSSEAYLIVAGLKVKLR